jgi:integrase
LNPEFTLRLTFDVIHHKWIGTWKLLALNGKNGSPLRKRFVCANYAKANPCVKLGLRRDKAKEKPSLTDKDITDIRAALKKRPAWMKVSFEIALYTGCRQSETQIAFTDIDFKRRTIRFREPKGGGEKTYVVELPKELIPTLLPLKKVGQAHTLKGVPNPLGHVWWEFFSRTMKRPDLCFHCTRVNFVTRTSWHPRPSP